MVKLTDKQLDEILSALSKNKKNKKRKKRKSKKTKKKTETEFFPKKPNFLNRNFGGGGGGGLNNFIPYSQPNITKIDLQQSDKDKFENKSKNQMDYFNQQIELIKNNNKRLEDVNEKVNTRMNLLVYPLKQIYDAVNNPLSNIRPIHPDFRVEEVDRNDGIGIIPRNDSLETMIGIQDQSFIEEDSLKSIEMNEAPDDDEEPMILQPRTTPAKVQFMPEEEEEEEDDPEVFFKKLEEDRKKRGRPKGSKNKVKTRSSGDGELVNQDFKTPEQKKGKGKQKKMDEFM